MSNQMVETLVGAAVVAVAAFFLFFAYGQTDQISGETYTIFATVESAAGIHPGTDVTIAGVKMGTVASVELNDRYRAEIALLIESNIELPEDSSMRTAFEGLFGGSYIRLDLGGSDVMLEDGDELAFATGSIDIVGLIQRAMFGGGNGDSD